LRKWTALPTWLLMKMGRRFFRKDHPWRQREKFFTLRDWHDGRTEVCMNYDQNFWCLGVILAVFIGVFVRHLVLGNF